MEKKSPVKRTIRSGSTAEENLDDSVEDVNVEEMVVKDEVVDDDADAELEQELEKEINQEKGNGDNQEPAVEEEAPVKEEIETVKEEPVAKEEPLVAKKREAPEVSEEPASKKVRIADSPIKLEPPGKRSSEANGMDTEDSINLEIGEDELLNEEVRTCGLVQI